METMSTAEQTKEIPCPLPSLELEENPKTSQLFPSSAANFSEHYGLSGEMSSLLNAACFCGAGDFGGAPDISLCEIEPDFAPGNAKRLRLALQQLMFEETKRIRMETAERVLDDLRRVATLVVVRGYLPVTVCLADGMALLDEGALLKISNFVLETSEHSLRLRWALREMVVQENTENATMLGGDLLKLCSQVLDTQPFPGIQGRHQGGMASIGRTASNLLGCGNPRVNLVGEKSHWESILGLSEKLKEYGLETIAWYHLLRPRDGESLHGWISVFMVFTKEGEWMGNELNDVSAPDPSTLIPPGYAELDILLIDNGVRFDCAMVGGSVGMRVTSSGDQMLSPHGKGDTLFAKDEDEEKMRGKAKEDAKRRDY
ncbi:hypothetical protein C8R45DRAFT_1079268 [Mycena sanguinolenta]|nr:hypothetical protein C8R45DRAFT_1079268 [Mycena sanguinolenta]